MKYPMRALLVLAAACVFAGPLAAQAKIAYFNSEAVMKQMPDALDAQKQLDGLVAEWQNELAKMQTEWQKAYDDYDKRKLILTEQRRADTERELHDMDQKIVAYRQQKFGPKGELFQKQEELMKPVQDRIFKAVQDVAVEEGYDYVFDKSGQIFLMYTNEKFDITAKVVTKIFSAPSVPRAK